MDTGPTRTCVGCRTKRSQAELIRIGRRGGAVTVGEPGSEGRGAYVCHDSSCIRRALKTGALRRALRLASLPADIEDRLLNETERRDTERRRG